MTRVVPVTFAVAAALLAAGCGTIPAEECGKVDWYALGVKDGRAGYTAERVAQHREACAGVKVEPDELAYLQGRKAGLAEYCQPDNAFRDGLAGNEYRGVCDAAYARNHAAAYRVATLRRSLERNRGDVSWREAEIRSDKTSDTRRAQLRSEVRDLDRRRDALRDDLTAAERELDRRRAAQPAAAPQPSAAAAAAPAAPAAVATTPAPPPVDVGKPGTASGRLVVAGTTVPLRYAYTFVAPDALSDLTRRPLLVLTGEPIPPDQLARAGDLDRVLGALPHYVLVVRNDAAPPNVAVVVAHPKLGAAPAVGSDVGKGAVAKFDAYGAQRIAGTLASPQNGGAAFAWNRNVRLSVKFDAPLARQW